MQKTKRPLSFLLAVLMIVSMFAAAPFSALAVPEGTPLTDQLPSTQGTYYLTQDITISSTWLAPSGATTLDLNGYGIRMTGTGTVIDVCRDASCVLTLNDSRPTYSGGENRPSGILGGYITGGTGSKEHPGTSNASYIVGGGIYVNNAVLNINGGTITRNSAAWGGGIYINDNCTVNMTGGAITGNSCARGGYGGGVFLSARSTFNVSHTPSITGNYSSYSGNKVTKNVHMQVVYSGGKPLYAVITIVSPGLTAGAQIGIYEYQTNQYHVTSGYSTYHSGVNPATYFSCDNAGYAYKVNEGELLSVPAFTITWLNEDGSLIDTTTVAGGTVPTHDAATKDATAQYTYTFAGWSDGTTTYAPDDALPEVIRNATYTATFTQTDREYTITWKNDDGSVIDTTTVPYGTVPTHADATKDADAQYSYTFAGWDKEIVAVTGDATYTATYTTSQSPAAIVIGKIDAIGTVEYTDACKAKIDAARDAYDALTDEQKAFVTNYTTLTDAETAYANLKAAADAAADPVSYLVWDDAARKLVEMTGDNACKTYTEVTADTATFEDGMWYVVNGEILNDNRITVTGTAHLILTDGSKLATYNGINVANGSTLNIYGQGAGTGTVTANGGSNKGAGIGGKKNESGGTVNIYGGTVTATGSGGGAGIGGGWASVGTGGTGGTITIYGGTVTANGSGMGGAGIGGGTSQSAGIVTIYGGTVTANGNNKSPGIGPGANGDGGTLTVCGGSVTAVGADRSIAIACTVKNTIPGTGWENVNGTGDETPIAINTEGQEYGFKKIQFLGVASNPDQEAADAVIALIDAIGTVEYTDACKAKIDDARNAYDALTDAQKALVNNYQTLLDAEAAYKAAAAASVQDWQSVTIADEIYINFIPSVRDDLESITVEYIDQGKVTQTLTYNDPENQLEKYDATHYLIPVEVAPAQIGDTIKATLKITGSNSIALDTSIAEYCNALIDGNYEQKYKDLAAATLEYGQAANNYFAGTGFYTAQSFAGTENAQAAVDAVANMDSTMTLDVDGKIVSAAFVALTTPEFRFPTTGLTEAEAVALNGTITVDGPNGVAAQFVKSASTGAILLEVTGIEAATMDQAVTITIDGFGTLTFCGNDFARLMAKNAATAVLGAALYNYGAAAKACFTA